MSMAQEIDYSTLKWVKDEIDESLKQTRQALEAFVDDPEDKTQIRFCATYLHQIYGTLQMVEIYGGALLAEEMELLCNAMLAEKVQQKEDAFDVLMRSILQLPSYLEHIEQGQPDQPVILLPLLNDLRSARGEHLLSDNAFFSPNMSVSPPAEAAKEDKKSVDIKQYAKKLRTVYQASLVGLYRDNNVKGNLKKIGAVFRELMSHADDDNGKRLWWVATGVVEALLENGLELSNAIKQVIGQLDKHVKAIIAKGDQAFNESANELLKNLLYYIATSKSNGKRVKQIKQAFNLDKLLPNSTDINEAYDSLRGSSQELMKSVSTVIKEDLLQVKDQLDIFVRSGDRSPTHLQPLEEQLRRVADTLAMLGLGDLRKIISDQIHSIDELIQGGQEPSDITLMEIASSLLYIESSLEGVETTALVESEEAVSTADSVLPANEQKQLSKLVITEAAEVLAKVKESFNSFANDPTQFNTISATPAYLDQVRGVLSMLSFERAATLLESAIGYIAQEIVQKQNEPNQAALDAIADVITSIEYYLEAVAEARLHPDSLLSVAEQSLSKLGYSIEEQAEILPPTEELRKPDLQEAIAPPAPEEPAELAAEAEPEFVFSLPQEEISSEPAIELPATDELETVEAEIKEPAIEEAHVSAQQASAEASPAALGDNVIASVKDQLVDDVDEEILEIFIEEADEVLVVMKENLAAWKADNNNNDALTILRRSYHTIKGSGRLAGATIVGEFAWAVENMLNRLIDGKITTSPQMYDLLERAQTGLEGLIAQLKGDSPTASDVRLLSEIADSIANGETVSAATFALASGTGDIAEQAAVAAEPAVPEEESITIELSDEPLAEEETEFVIEEMPTEAINLADRPTQELTLSEIFQKETATHLASIRAYVEEFSSADKRVVTEPLMRALHTLHGSARMADATHIAALSEALDRYFRTLQDSDQHLSNDAFEVLRNSADAIAEISAHEDQFAYQPPHFQQLLDQVANLHRIASEAQSAKEAASVAPEEQADKELVSIFLEEAAELLVQVETTLSRWQDNLEDSTVVSELQRALHTLKGGARMANIGAVADVTHNLETVLEQIGEGQMQANSELLDLTHACYDWLTNALDDLHISGSVAPAQQLVQRCEQYLSQTPAAESAIELPQTQEFEQRKTLEFEMLDLPEEVIPPQPLEVPGTMVIDAGADEELLGIFLEEAHEIQESNEQALDKWRDDVNNLEYIAELQRGLHTLKGGARMASVTAIADVAHAVETLLEAIVDNQLVAQANHVDLVQRCHDWLSHAIDGVQNREAIPSSDELLRALEQMRSESEAAEISATPPVEEEPQPKERLEAAIEEPAAEDIEESTAFIELAELQDEAIEEEPQPATAEIIHLETEPQFTISQEIHMEEPPAAASAASSDYDEDLVDIFLEEADELQENNDKILHEWVSDVENRTLIAELQRSLHTLKGGARMANITAIGDLAHAIESLLEGVTEGNMQPSAEFPTVVHNCHDWLSHAIDTVKQRKPLESGNHLISQLENLLAGKAAMEGLESAPAPSEAIAEAQPIEEISPAELIELPVAEPAQTDEAVQRLRHGIARAVDEQVRVRADLIDQLVNHAGEVNIYNARIEQQLNAWRFNLTELNQTVERLHEQLRKFEIEAETQIMYRHTAETGDEDTHADFDPLEMDRFSYMQQLSRGMVESLGDLTSIQNLLESVSGDADVLLLQQSRINNDLHEGLMRTRMTPFSSVLARLRRIVRQTCQETGKEANLNVVGAEGEMDRTQLNRVVPALEHILRNAIDHGIEIPEERSAANKPRAGNIEINFTREGSEVVLRIQDDGAGINIDALREKAIERGLISKDTKISDNEVTEFILHSGFSTAKEVTQISGRGVGMDVVNTEIKQLNGSLHIESQRNEGSAFVIRLPLTVLVNQALMVHINEANYAIQMSNIEHVVRVRGDVLNQLSSGQMEYYAYAGNQYEPLNVAQVLHGTKPPHLEEKSTFPLLLGRSGDHRVAVQVDELLGRQEIVIKSLGPQLSSVSNISGATILPDGEVALILDLSTLIRSNMALQQILSEGIEELVTPAEVQVEEEQRQTVMIVDDSITVRKVTQRLLERHNFDTITAKDGVDALTMLLEHIPDVMLLDVEMPRMDGFELATAIRNDERLKHIPIIMITSRTGAKHRDRALGIGVNMYMGKPYQETELLENIQSLINND